MITFKLVSKNGSRLYYKFSALGLNGIICIDCESLDIHFENATGLYSKDEKEKAQILYIAKNKLQSMDFPESCIYATH